MYFLLFFLYIFFLNNNVSECINDIFQLLWLLNLSITIVVNFDTFIKSCFITKMNRHHCKIIILQTVFNFLILFLNFFKELNLGQINSLSFESVKLNKITT